MYKYEEAKLSEYNFIHSLNYLPSFKQFLFKTFIRAYEFYNERKRRESFKHFPSVTGVLFQIYLMYTAFENIFLKCYGFPFFHASIFSLVRFI